MRVDVQRRTFRLRLRQGEVGIAALRDGRLPPGRISECVLRAAVDRDLLERKGAGHLTEGARDRADLYAGQIAPLLARSQVRPASDAVATWIRAQRDAVRPAGRIEECQRCVHPLAGVNRRRRTQADRAATELRIVDRSKVLADRREAVRAGPRVGPLGDRLEARRVDQNLQVAGTGGQRRRHQPFPVGIDPVGESRCGDRVQRRGVRTVGADLGGSGAGPPLVGGRPDADGEHGDRHGHRDREDEQRTVSAPGDRPRLKEPHRRSPSRRTPDQPAGRPQRERRRQHRRRHPDDRRHRLGYQSGSRRLPRSDRESDGHDGGGHHQPTQDPHASTHRRRRRGRLELIAQ